MKTIFLSFILAAFTIAVAADTAPLTGNWQVHTNIADRQSEWNCAFVQTANDLAGTCESPAGSGAITGKIDDKKVTWTQKFNSEANGPITLNFRGALNSATNITGFVTVAEYGVDGEFSATQTK